MKNFNLLAPFQEPDGSWSWRKTGTALCFILFVFVVVGYAIANKFAEIPASYQAIIAGVFAFYFFKKRIGGETVEKDE